MDFVNLIETHYLSTPDKLKVMDLARVSQYFTLDVITDMAFGYPFGFLAANADLYNYISSFGPLMPIFELQANITWIGAILNNPWIKKLLSPTANDGSAVGQMIGVAQQAVKERYKPGAEQKDDMMTSFMRRGITQLEAESESLLQVFAGADSTATAVRMIMYLIMTNPPVQAKLLAELNSAKLTWPVATEAEAKSLPYLQAVIKEGLRAWPPGVGISTKLVPAEGEMLEDGRFIPGGTRIGWSAWGAHHDKSIYGEDAHFFRPERWLEAGDQLGQMEKVQDLMFGSGRYGCLGKSLAMVELNKIFVTVRLSISSLPNLSHSGTVSETLRNDCA
jgi:cytochrome P450